MPQLIGWVRKTRATDAKRIIAVTAWSTLEVYLHVGMNIRRRLFWFGSSSSFPILTLDFSADLPFPHTLFLISREALRVCDRLANLFSGFWDWPNFQKGTRTAELRFSGRNILASFTKENIYTYTDYSWCEQRSHWILRHTWQGVSHDCVIGRLISDNLHVCTTYMHMLTIILLCTEFLGFDVDHDARSWNLESGIKCVKCEGFSWFVFHDLHEDNRRTIEQTQSLGTNLSYWNRLLATIRGLPHDHLL